MHVGRLIVKNENMLMNVGSSRRKARAWEETRFPDFAFNKTLSIAGLSGKTNEILHVKNE